jgi:hypothetical protein
LKTAADAGSTPGESAAEPERCPDELADKNPPAAPEAARAVRPAPETAPLPLDEASRQKIDNVRHFEGLGVLRFEPASPEQQSLASLALGLSPSTTLAKVGYG